MDWEIREGNLTARLAYPLPFIPGWDVSGTVAAAGPGVTKLQKGNEVFSRPDIARNGAYAEYIGIRYACCGSGRTGACILFVTLAYSAHPASKTLSGDTHR